MFSAENGTAHSTHSKSRSTPPALVGCHALAMSGVIVGRSVGRRCVKGEHKRWMLSVSIGANPPLSSFHWLSPPQAAMLNTWYPAGGLSWGYDG